MKCILTVVVVMLSAIAVSANDKPKPKPKPPLCPGGECPKEEGKKQCGTRANGQEVLVECKSGCWTILPGVKCPHTQ
ncbi:hypothetical protein DE146DRAFT_788375 [Phaeosphaeria sp. MPI-PUGE-AT-0046c]|nr:hypothetical protein DE146DRAFT_788375 [Phaeosphaeria sp. MPI-PUGE-AT-0046c]